MAYKNREIVGTFSKNFDWVDCFALDIEIEEDAPFLVAVVIAVDNIFDKYLKDTSN